MLARQVVCFCLGALVAFGVVALWGRSRPPTRGLREVLLANPEFLADNPDILQAARSVLQTRALASESASRRRKIRDKWATATLAAFAPTLGDSKAKSVLIEFTDYTCVPCKASAAVIERALAKNPDLRVALMFVPIGGATAEYAARVAFAAYQQDPARFAAFHAEVMAADQPLTQQTILDAAASAGLDVSQIEREIGAQQNRAYLDQARMFAADLNIAGVPAFVMNGGLIIGGLTPPKLDQLMRTGSDIDAI